MDLVSAPNTKTIITMVNKFNMILKKLAILNFFPGT